MINTETRTAVNLVELLHLHRPVMIADPDRESGEVKVCAHCLELVQFEADFAEPGPAEWPCRTAELLGNA